MSKNLVIVESPAKARTISGFLGKEYTVKASMGHIRDLPKSKMSIDIEHNFEPTYVIPDDKKKVITDLKKELKNGPKVWIATDEDREGEAIGWHLCHALGVDPEGTERIVFHEITKDAILNSLDSPRKINQDLVNAQQARRVLDRIVGYELSPLLWKKVRPGLSAGRVQSVALRIIVEREEEIRAFDPEEYWKIQSVFSAPDLTAELVRIDGKQIRPKNKPALIDKKDKAEKVEKELNESEFVISSVKEKAGKKTPAPPFTTSTLQQEASRKLGFSVKQTMTLAQKLYEGNGLGLKNHKGGLITYMRTDSLNMAKQALADARDVIGEKYGKDYLPEKPRYYKTKSKGAQEAHEAIRPVKLSLLPSEIKNEMDDLKIWKLYNLIWERAVACQMAEAKVTNTTITIEAGKYELETKGQVINFMGFLKVYTEGSDDEEISFKGETVLPKVKEGEKCDLKEILKEQNFTAPPPRYTEASLVKKLESEGIGRPSTYAPTISTIQTRGYVEKDEQKKLKPTELGEIVSGFLVEHFPKIVDYKFTANVEEDFDEIAEGKKEWNKLIKDFYGGFHGKVEEKEKTVKKEDLIKETTDEVCDKCGKPMQIKLGRYGKFLSCSNYPECKNAKPYGEDAKKMEEMEKQYKDEKCPNCGKPMVVKRGRYGEFVACSDYPECKTVKKVVKEIGVDCPNCGKPIAERKTRKGKIFYGCTGYPKCKTAYWQKPTGEKCPDCGEMLTSTPKGTIKCSSKECKYTKKDA